MKPILWILLVTFISLLAACTDDPIEKCVSAQVKAADEREKQADTLSKITGATNFGNLIRETPTEVEARARLQCLKAASGKN